MDNGPFSSTIYVLQVVQYVFQMVMFHTPGEVATWPYSWGSNTYSNNSSSFNPICFNHFHPWIPINMLMLRFWCFAYHGGILWNPLTKINQDQSPTWMWRRFLRHLLHSGIARRSCRAAQCLLWGTTALGHLTGSVGAGISPAKYWDWVLTSKKKHKNHRVHHYHSYVRLCYITKAMCFNF